jgi:hypothetical protein
MNSVVVTGTARIGTQPFVSLQHLISRSQVAPPRALIGGRVMELAAILMVAAVVFGFVQQFDRQHW